MQSLLYIPRNLIFGNYLKIFGCRGKGKKRRRKEGKGEKTTGEENIFFRGGIETRTRKIFVEGKYLVHRGEEEQRKKRRKTKLEKQNVTMRDRQTDIVKKELELWTQISQKKSSICLFHGAVFPNILALLVCFCSSLGVTTI